MKKDYGIRVGETIQAFENILYLDVMYKGKIVGMKVLVEVE